MRILVVEDEHKIAHSLQKGLEQERLVVDVAYDGPHGYDLATTEQYDLLIIDWMLPGMDGVTLCRQLRTDGKHVPILLLTAKSQINDKVQGLDAGADDYLTKPFAFVELLARVRALTRRPPTTQSPVLKVDDLTLDTTTYQVTRAERPLSLSHKEYVLLAYLMRHPHHILTKEQIINHVWDYDANVLPNTVEVYIGYLRQKIDRPFPQQPPLIHTVRGYGYRFGAEK
jgi:DNA-binding response OmpR family regulator